MLALALKYTTLSGNYRAIYPATIYHFTKFIRKDGLIRYEVSHWTVDNDLAGITNIDEKEFKGLLNKKRITPIPNSYFRKLVEASKGDA